MNLVEFLRVIAGRIENYEKDDNKEEVLRLIILLRDSLNDIIVKGYLAKEETTMSLTREQWNMSLTREQWKTLWYHVKEIGKLANSDYLVWRLPSTRTKIESHCDVIKELVQSVIGQME